MECAKYFLMGSEQTYVEILKATSLNSFSVNSLYVCIYKIYKNNPKIGLKFMVSEFIIYLITALTI